MAPSPELGQPKAPDKTSSGNGSGTSLDTSKKQTSSGIGGAIVSNHLASNAADLTTNCSNMTTSIPTTSSGANSSSGSGGAPTIVSSNSSSSTSQEKSSKNFEHMNYADFSQLLYEAYTYKIPKDRENKSDTFKQLLVEAERRDDNPFPIITRNPRGSNSRHGGSLQNLVESANEYLDNDYTYGRNNRRYHYNSRTTPKYSSSVSTRQREGGSLPSNVNVSNCHLNEPRFLNEVAAGGSGAMKRRGGRNERTCSGTSYESKDETNTVIGGDNAIIGIENSEDRYQAKSNAVDINLGVDVQTTMNLKTTLEITCPESKHNNLVDDTVTFASLERGKTTVDTNCVLPFDDSSKSCQSVLGEKPEKPKTTIYQASKILSQQPIDDSSNSMGNKKKKKFDADRNTTTINAEEAEGYRGRESIDTLVKFIESTESKKSDNNGDLTKRSDKNCTMSGKKKEKKKEKDTKKEIHKVKKSTSMEELRSCTKLDEDDKLESGVVLRSKGKKGNSMLATSSNDGKENSAVGSGKPNSKRGERRSWGTEELTYLGESQTAEMNRERTAKEKEKSKKIKENTEKMEKTTQNMQQQQQQQQKKKKNERSASVHSVEQIQSELDEFHVVTKKKKSKKRQSLEETRIVGKHNPFSSKHPSTGQKKYQSSNSFSNDRDAYLSAYNAHESRRKSTSSVPPSEKSDSSDLDSVHSLPIGSVSGNGSSHHHHLHHQSANNSAQAQHQSYADIARTVNGQKQYAAIAQSVGSGTATSTQSEKWPAVTAALSNLTINSVAVLMDSMESNGSGTANKNRLSTVKSKSAVKDFPDLMPATVTAVAVTVTPTNVTNSNDCASSCSSSSSTSTIGKQQVSYSQSLSDEKFPTDLAKTLPAAGPVPVPFVTATTTKLTEISKMNEVIPSVNKQTLQKSRSADNERFYSVEQYPALEKTIKRHATQNPISDTTKPVQSVSPTATTVTSLEQANSSKPRSALSTVQNHQQQQQQPPPQQQHQPLVINNNAGNVMNYSTTASSSSCLTTALTMATSASSDTSKIVINNLDMNTNVAATSSSNLSNTNSSCSSTSSNNSLSNDRKSKVSTKVGNESSNSTIVVAADDVKNSMVVLPQLSQPSSNYAVEATQNISGGINRNLQTNMFSINTKKSHKSEPQQMFGANAISSRKPRREKQSGNDDMSSSGGMGSHQQHTSLSKNSNRPAVIILNDLNDGSLGAGGDFTFGDFNEEELRLFESSQPLDDSATSSHNVSGPDVNSSTSLTSDLLTQEDIHMSPHSDLGYSSSNNRSLFSESMENNTNNNSSSTGTISTRTFMNSDEIRTIPSATTVMSSSPTSYSSSSSSSCSSSSNISAQNVVNKPASSSTTTTIQTSSHTPFPNDSAIIIATKSCPKTQSHHPLQHQSNIIHYGSVKMPPASVANMINKNLLTEKDGSGELVMRYERNDSSCDNLNNNLNNISHSSIDSHSEILIPSSSQPVTATIQPLMSQPSMVAGGKQMAIASRPSLENFAGTETNAMDDNNNSNSANYVKIVSNNTTTVEGVGGVGSSGRGITAISACDSNAIITPTSAAVSDIQKSNCDNMRKFNRREINIRFVAPPESLDINSINYEKLVDFVGLAWEDILHGVNGETEFYDGQ